MSADRFTDKVVIVTGGVSGIGDETTQRYAGNKERADETVAGIVSAGGRAIAVGGDVADETDMATLFDAAECEFGGVDVLVHTDGIMPLSPIADLDLEVFDRVQRTNVRGTFVVDQLAAQRMRESGAIINFSTSVTRYGDPVVLRGQEPGADRWDRGREPDGSPGHP